MLRHIVWWTLKPQTENQSADDNANFILNASAELQSNPYASQIEVSAKVDESSTVPAQVVLLATFENMDQLVAYHNDPVTKRFIKMVEERADSKNIINYTVLPNLSKGQI